MGYRYITILLQLCTCMTKYKTGTFVFFVPSSFVFITYSKFHYSNLSIVYRVGECNNPKREVTRPCSFRSTCFLPEGADSDASLPEDGLGVHVLDAFWPTQKII